MDRVEKSVAVPPDDEDGQTVVLSERPDLIRDARRTYRPPAKIPTVEGPDSNTRIKGAPAGTHPYSDLVEDDRTSVLEPKRLDDLKSSMQSREELFASAPTQRSSPPPRRGAMQVTAKPPDDSDKTSVWDPKPEARIPTSDEITRRPILRPPPQPEQPVQPEQLEREYIATLPPALALIPRAETPKQLTTVFLLGVLVGFLCAVALGLGLLLFLVTTGRVSFVG